MNTSPRRLPSALLLLLLLPPAPTRAEVFESNGWRIEKTVQSTTPTSVTYYIDLNRIGPDAGVVAYADERDPATTDGYGPDTSPPLPFSGGGSANTIVWTQNMPQGASTYAMLTTILKPDLPPGARVVNRATVTDSNGTTSVKHTLWIGQGNDTTKASGSGHLTRDPVNTRTGEYVYDPGADFDLGGPLPVRFVRWYASRLDDPGTERVRSALGPGWMHNFDVQLVRQDPAAPDRSFFVVLPGGKRIPFTEMEDGTWTLNLVAPLSPYSLKSDGEDLWFCDPDQGVLYRFDDADRAGVKEIADRNGNGILIGRRADGLATNATDGLGRELRFEYNAASNLVRVTDGTRSVSFGYGAHGELAAATNALGKATAYAYDPTNSFANGNGALMTAVRFPLGNVPLVQTYDADGRVVRQADADGIEATFEYGAAGFTTYGVVTDPDGSAIRHEYGANGSLYKAFDAYSNYFQYGFSGGRDALGTFRDRRGNNASISVDAATRRVYEAMDRFNARTMYQHRTNAQVFTNREFPARTLTFTFHDLRTVTNANSFNTSSEVFDCDARGNVTGYVDRAGSAWIATCDGRGRRLAVARPGGGMQTFTYNPDGTLASKSDPDTGTTTYAYDGLRRLVGVTWSDGSAGWVLDDLDRVTAYTDPVGGVSRFEYDDNGNRIRQTDPLGGEATEQTDRMDRTTNRMDSLGPRTATTYDAMGRPAAVADPAKTNACRYDLRGWVTNLVRGSRTWTQSHDKEGNVTNAISPGGATNRYQYNRNGWLTAWNDPLFEAHLQSETWIYDFRGNLTRHKNRMGETSGFGLDPADRLVVFTNPAGSLAYFEYDADGNRTRQTDFDGRATTFGYTPMGRLTAVTNALGETTRIEYDSAGRPARTTFADGAREEFAYDAAGRVKSMVDAGTNAWRLARNARGEVVAVTNPAGGVTTYVYNLDGTLRSVADSDVGPVSNRYDAARRLVETAWPDGARIQYEYNEHDELVGVADALGQTTTFAYDPDGRLVATVDALGRTNRYSYDALGRLTNAVDRAGGSASGQYDLVGRPTAATDATGVRTTLIRDRLGQITNRTVGTSSWSIVRNRSGAPVARQTPLGRRTDYGRDALHRVARITNALGQTSTRAYDARGRATALADPAGRTTEYAYDPRGMLSAIRLPDSNAVAYVWNALGQLERLADFNGAEWTFAYTPMGRLLSATDPLFRATLCGYDANGRLASLAHAGGGTTAYTRDAVGRVVRILHSAGPDLPFQRDALGRITNANGVARAYDAEGRILSETHAGIPFAAAYDAAGRLASAAYDGGAFTVAYQYSTGPAGTGRLTNVVDGLTGTKVAFGYDDDLRLRTATLSNGEVITTTWDALDRLARLQSGEQVDLEMAYDLSGRVTNVVGYAPLDPSGHVAAAIASLTFDAASQISSPGYAHDARGRVTATPERTFGWDGASRLTNANGAVCAYDGFNQLRTRAAAAGTNRFFYLPAIAGAPLVAEKDEATGAPLRYYVWTPGGRLLYMIDAANGNAVFFYHFDATGNALALTDANKAVAAAYAYDPYGRLLARTGSVTQPFTFSGAWGVRQDGDSGTLYQMRARWYDATLGRFLSPEPLWPQIGEPQALNPYQYAGGDPIRFADPSGWSNEYLSFDLLLISEVAGRQWNDLLRQVGPGRAQVVWDRIMAHPAEALDNELMKEIGYVLAKELVAAAHIIRDLPTFDRLRESAMAGRQWNDLLRRVDAGRAHVIWDRIMAHPEEGWSNEWVEEIGYVLAKELIAAAHELQKDSTAQRQLLDMLAFRLGPRKASDVFGKLLAHPQERWVERATEMGVVLPDERVAALMESPPAQPTGVKSHRQPMDVQPQNPPDPAQDYAVRLGKKPGLTDQTVRYQPVAAPAPDPLREKSAGIGEFAPRTDDLRVQMAGIVIRALNSGQATGPALVKTLVDQPARSHNALANLILRQLQNDASENE